MTYEDKLRARGCDGKRRYIQRVHAHRAKKLAAKLGSGHQHVYKCRFCGFWHLGHNDGATGMRRGRSEWQ